MPDNQFFFNPTSQRVEQKQSDPDTVERELARAEHLKDKLEEWRQRAIRAEAERDHARRYCIRRAEEERDEWSFEAYNLQGLLDEAEAETKRLGVALAQDHVARANAWVELKRRAERAEAERDTARIALQHGERVALDRIRRTEAERDELRVAAEDAIACITQPYAGDGPVTAAKILREALRTERP